MKKLGQSLKDSGYVIKYIVLSVLVLALFPFYILHESLDEKRDVLEQDLEERFGGEI